MGYRLESSGNIENPEKPQNPEKNASAEGTSSEKEVDDILDAFQKKTEASGQEPENKSCMALPEGRGEGVYAMETTEQKEYPTLESMEDKKYYDDAASKYIDARKVAKKCDLKQYTEHGFAHVSKVIERSSEAADVIKEVSGKECDMKNLSAAALYHDTGMDGADMHGPDENGKGDDIRKNHAVSSAVHVLQNRPQLEEEGCDADTVAALCTLHNKSCSGVYDLSSDDKIQSAFEKIQDNVDQYNETHPDQKISFDPSSIDVEKLKYTAAALRFGDAEGHDASETTTQSGDHYEIDFSTQDIPEDTEWNEDTYMKAVKQEVQNGSLTLVEGDQSETIDDSKDPKGITRMYQFGEGNLANMHCVSQDADGKRKVNMVIDVKDDTFKPQCTIGCIHQRKAELETAENLDGMDCAMTVNLYGAYDQKTKELYEDYARKQITPIKIQYVGGTYDEKQTWTKKGE